MNQFKVGQNIVYPGHGVGEVIRIESKVDSTFYRIRIYFTGMYILVPTTSSAILGLRPLVDADTAKRAKLIIETSSTDAYKDLNWSRRYRDLMERLNSNDIIETAYVISQLKTLADNKDLSFGERKMLDYAKCMVDTEIDLVLKTA